MEKPSVYDFLDYRQFLRAFYEAEKVRLPAFSYRYFARKAGFSSPNFLKLVIEGERNLSTESTERFVEVLRLPVDEATFFRDLVAFNQARTLAEKNSLFERVIASKRFQVSRRLDGALLECLRHWYYPAIRELAGRADFSDDPAWIAQRLTFPISREEILRALEVLQELGLLARGEDGRLSRTDRTLSTGNASVGAAKVVARAFLRQMLERASDSLDVVPASGRDVSCITVAIRAESVNELKDRILRFRRELLELCDQEPSPDSVYQLSIQLFPLAKEPSK